jgi:hypothetical protein
MKLSIALLAAICSNLGHANPITSPRDFSHANPILAARVAQQETCSTIDRIIESIGTSNSVVVYTTAGGVTALSVCNLLHNHGIGPIGPSDCQNYGAIVASVVAVIFTATSKQSALPAPAQKTERFVESAAGTSLSQHLIASFAADGVEYDSIVPLAMSPSSKAKRHLESRQMIEHFSILGYKYNQNTTVDAIVADFGNGEGHIFVTPSPPATATPGLSKRHQGPGFKLSFTERERSQLSRQHQLQMSDRIASDWGQRADRNRITEWIGFERTGHTANFYLRIIPEIRGYGENYESVDAPCGQMGRFL